MLGKLNHSHKNKRSNPGQALVEMAIMLPFLLVMIITTVELGRLFFTKIVLTNAAREGAFYLSMHPSDYDIGTGNAQYTTLAARAEAMSSGISDINVVVTPVNCCTKGEYSVIVTVDTTVDDLLILGFFDDVFSVSATKYEGYVLSSSVEMLVQ